MRHGNVGLSVGDVGVGNLWRFHHPARCANQHTGRQARHRRNRGNRVVLQMIGYRLGLLHGSFPDGFQVHGVLRCREPPRFLIVRHHEDFAHADRVANSSDGLNAGTQILVPDFEENNVSRRPAAAQVYLKDCVRPGALPTPCLITFPLAILQPRRRRGPRAGDHKFRDSIEITRATIGPPL